MSKPITIPIKSHTRVRRPVSSWHISLVDGERYIHYFTKDRYDALYQDAFYKPKPVVVQDIKRVHKPSVAGYPEKIIGLFDEAVKQQKGDWNKWHKDMNSRGVSFDDDGFLIVEEGGTVKSQDYYAEPPKPSLLTRLKNRFKR